VPGDPAIAVLGEQATRNSWRSSEQSMAWIVPRSFLAFPEMRMASDTFAGTGLAIAMTITGSPSCTAIWELLFAPTAVVDLILERYPATIELAIVAMLIAVSIAIPLGVIAGKNRGTLTDNALSVIALVGTVCPDSLSGRCWFTSSRLNFSGYRVMA